MKKGFFVSMVLLPIVAALALFGVSKEEEEVSRQQHQETPDKAVESLVPPVAEQKLTKTRPSSEPAAKSEKIILAKTEDSSSDERVKKAVESVLKDGPAIEHAWKKYRLELYTKAGLSRQDIIDLDLLLNRYNDHQQELQDRYNGSSPEEQKAIALQMDESFKKMDQEVEAFLGPKRFNYIKQARTKFTREYNKENNTHIETTAW